MLRGLARSRWALVATTLVVCSVTGASASRAATALFTLDVLLTVAPDLPDGARRSLLAEAGRIWGREGVALRWPAARGGAERPAAPLRVLVIPRPEAADTGEDRWPVAELVPQTDQRALAIASITSALRVLQAAMRESVTEPRALADHRLGLVLGRAVAHEIGHFLLATGTHAEAGLMRESIDAREFAALAGEPFQLDVTASQWLRERLRAGGNTPALLPIASLHAFR